jgi:hypothetical protein
VALVAQRWRLKRKLASTTNAGQRRGASTHPASAPMNRYLLGSFLAAIALFAFGAVFWMSPMGSLGFRIAPDDDLAAVSVQTAFPQDGTFYVPGPGDGQDREGWFARHRAGPIAMVHIRHEGAAPM